MLYLAPDQLGEDLVGAAVDRPHPQLYIGDKPWVPQLPPYRLPPHVEGVRGGTGWTACS